MLFLISPRTFGSRGFMQQTKEHSAILLIELQCEWLTPESPLRRRRSRWLARDWECCSTHIRIPESESPALKYVAIFISPPCMQSSQRASVR